MEADIRDADNTSPDSGLELEPPRKPQPRDLLNIRRLGRNIEKSLSQDSDYSLCFDAEEFLQDMGFAGAADPTIPDRFLPSLMHRLARFPDSEMESLHDRIIQSIGCFRRKEGKRRLFRNLSMGPRRDRHSHLGISHPLLRSNTDPSFRYEEVSSSDSTRLSSNESSRLHSMGSSREEFPDSPIAILVSSASMDHDSQVVKEEKLEETGLADDVEDSSVRQHLDRDEDSEKSEEAGLADDVEDCRLREHLDCDQDSEKSEEAGLADDVEDCRLREHLDCGQDSEKSEEAGLADDVEDCRLREHLDCGQDSEKSEEAGLADDVEDCRLREHLDCDQDSEKSEEAGLADDVEDCRLREHLDCGQDSRFANEIVDGMSDQRLKDIVGDSQKTLGAHLNDYEESEVSAEDGNVNSKRSCLNTVESIQKTLGIQPDHDQEPQLRNESSDIGLDEGLKGPMEDIQKAFGTLTDYNQCSYLAADIDDVEPDRDLYDAAKVKHPNKDIINGDKSDTQFSYTVNDEDKVLGTHLEVSGQVLVAESLDVDVAKSGSEFVRTADEIQKLTNKISYQEIFKIENVCDSNEFLIGPTQIDKNEDLNDETQTGQRKQSEDRNPFMDYKHSKNDNRQKFHSLKYSQAYSSDDSLDLISDDNKDTHESPNIVTFSNAKNRLRRTSNAQFYDHKFLKKLTFLNHSDDELSNAANETFESAASQFSYGNEGRYANKEIDEDILNCTPFKYSDSLLNNLSEPGFVTNASPVCVLPLKTSPPAKNNNSTKPKYSRGDSLTNFLSSMLDTGEIPCPRPTIPIMKPVSKTICNSDSEIPGSFASSPYKSFNDTGLTHSSSELQREEIFSTFSTDKNVKVIEKLPNRKRRVLRRMSSSLQYDDDVNCSDSSGLLMNSVDSGKPSSKMVSTPETSRRQKISHGTVKSKQLSHHVIHTCNSVPAITSCNYCNVRKENFGCSKKINDNCNFHTENEKNSFYFRKCKRRRNQSCPSPEANLNGIPWFEPNTDIKNFHTEKCITRNHQQEFIENNRHRSLGISNNFVQDDKWNGHCCNACYRAKECHSNSRKNSPYSRSSKNCESDIGYFGPLLHSRTDSSVFESNLRDQNRHFCFSNPELRHEFCPAVQNRYDEQCMHKPLRHLDEFGSNPFRPQTSFDCQSFDSVFYTDSQHCCSYQHNSYRGGKQGAEKQSVRGPHRQSSISDSQVQAASFFKQNSDPITFNKKNIVPPQPVTPPTKDNTKDYSTPLKITEKELQMFHDVPSSNFVAENKPTPVVDISERKAEGASAFPSNKSEALLERKIRIFSKFLANLGNLPKPIPDSDNKHRFTVPSDKNTKTSAPRVSCPASNKHPPGFGKLLNLIKSMDGPLHDLPQKSVVKSPENYYKVCENKVLLQTCVKQQSALQPDTSNVIGNGVVPLLDSSKKYDEIFGESHIPLVYENKVLLQTCVDEKQHRTFEPVLYTTSVSLFINNGDNDIQTSRKECLGGGRSQAMEVDSPEDFAPHVAQCASKEFPELHSADGTEENHTITKGKKLPSVDASRCDENGDAQANRALSDLRDKSKREVLEDTSFWQDELRKVKEETKQEWEEKVSRMEARLLLQEEELKRVHGGAPPSPRDSPQHCANSGRTDSAFEDDEECRQPPIPAVPCARQECDRLQRRLAEEEQRADQLNLMLDQKSIELNKIQITLSKQTKEMIELEKSFLHLQCRVRRGTRRPLAPRLCSTSSTPFSPKIRQPPSPPASPSS